jgi:hypothetical protein
LKKLDDFYDFCNFVRVRRAETIGAILKMMEPVNGMTTEGWEGCA